MKTFVIFLTSLPDRAASAFARMTGEEKASRCATGSFNGSGETRLFQRLVGRRFGYRKNPALQSIALRCWEGPRVLALSSRSRWCAAKHADGYRDTVYRQVA